jgi:phosphate transport system substrate-binding protein
MDFKYTEYTNIINKNIADKKRRNIKVKKYTLKKFLVVTTLVAGLVLTAACGSTAENEKNSNGTEPGQTEKMALSGEIKVDGSSTVFPITEAVVEEFNKIYPDVRVPVGVAGTGGGMKKFVTGEIDICDASRAIKQEEDDKAKANNIEYVEFEVAYDGITVVINKENDWAKSITTADLKKIWEPDSKVMKWKDINPNWPDAKIKLFGPGMDSGTMEFFTEKINGKAKEIRKDYTPSEDDNVLVQGIAGDKNAMGFFGFAYYVENKDSLGEVAIDTGSGAVMPSFDTIKKLTYKPLSRPLYIYVNKKALEKEHVKEFINFYLTEGTKLVEDIGYVPLDDYTNELAKLK